jgi:alkaline phosphatase
MKHLNKTVIIALLSMSAASAQQTPAKNVIFFLGDGAGISSLNAASIYGYGRPQALYLQQVPNLALADSSTAKEWVTDAAAALTAVATGVKTRNGVVSQTATAVRDVSDGANLKTILEYAEERGLSTGIIANDNRTGVTIAAVAAFYAHSNNRQRSAEIFQQILNPKFGNGPDVVIGTGLKWISAESARIGHNIDTEIPARGYAYVHSLDEVKQLDPAKDRLIALFDDEDFDLNTAVEQAVARLSRNPKGYFLVVFSDCHLSSARKSLTRIIELDKTVRAAAELHQKDTLVLMTADHSYDLRIKGESLVETSKSASSAQVASAISLEEQHTAEEVPVVAVGPGAGRLRGFISNTDIFHVMMGALGWEKYRREARYPVPGEGGWDYITIDSDARRLYVSHETQVNVLDADTGKSIGVIADTPGVHGTAIASAQKHGFTSNGKEGKVSMFDLETLQLIRKIDVGKGPDGIYFDATSHRVFTNNHGSHDVSAIDAVTGELAGTVNLEGDGEQAVVAANGLIYVNSENTSEVVAFDPKTLEVKSRFPLGDEKTPTGLAYDGRTNRLFIGCRNAPKMVVMDAASGKVIASMPIGAGVDPVAWDADSKTIFFSSGDGILSLFHQKSADEYEDLGPVMTQPTAKTMAFDAKTKRVYLPAAEVDVIPATSGSERPKRVIRPGTFAVLVLRPAQKPAAKP